MRKNLIMITLFLIGLSACNSSFQYDVYVKNSTGENIEIFYKTEVDKEGIKETSLLLKNEEQQRIISTSEISPEQETNFTTAKHCNLVAKYVTAKLENGTPSKLEWCDESIKFAVVDIGQGEFTIEYTKKDF